MTTIGIPQREAAALPHPARAGSMVRQLLLASGIASSLLYAATDLAGGLSYPGYSFSSQAISELGAIGAPSKPLIDPLFLAYDLLLLAFGIGVVREAASSGRALRVAGAALIACGAIGFAAGTLAGPLTFAMHPRGGPVANDTPHILLTAVLVFLLLLAMGFGAFALGRRFRLYSFATMATSALFGALTMPYPARMEAGLPTPGFGIIERIDVYASMLWVAVLGVALLRNRRDAAQRQLP